MNIPNNLKYTDSHEWIEFIDETTIRVGLTDFAQNAMGSLVFVNLPDADASISAGESLGDVESVKAVSDVNSPATGTITAVNEDLLDAPEMINDDPYGSWMVQITEITEQVDLMDAQAYEAFCEEEE